MNPLTLRVSDEEMEILKMYCDKTDRTQTDVLRAYIRSLEGKVKSINPSNIDPSSLPSQPWSMRSKLPGTCAVYFVLDPMANVLYVGQTKNLRNRLVQEHPAKNQLLNMNDCRIAWIELNASKLIEYEKKCIESLKPLLNKRCG